MLDERANIAIWQFATSLYAKPHVAQTCLMLQERYALDVNLLLFGAWVGAEFRIHLTRDDIAQANAAVEQWHKEIVRPLRAVRTRMKAGPLPGPSVATEALRSKLKLVEIEAERIELETLATTCVPPHGADLAGGREVTIRTNIEAVVTHFTGGSFDTEFSGRLQIMAATAATLSIG
jgi:uncharacterized protein (TIGR02444 family)